MFSSFKVRPPVNNNEFNELNNYEQILDRNTYQNEARILQLITVSGHLNMRMFTADEGNLFLELQNRIGLTFQEYVNLSNNKDPQESIESLKSRILRKQVLSAETFSQDNQVRQFIELAFFRQQNIIVAEPVDWV